MRRTAALLALTAVAALPSATAAAAAPDDADGGEEHCVVDVVDQRKSGELVLGPPDCYATFDQAQASLAPAGAKAGGGWVGIHYEGAGFTGSSITVSGTVCNGGWLNLTVAWRNRISSTLNNCPSIRHFDGLNLTGSNSTTYGSGGSLGALDNRTESIQYNS